MQRPLVALAAAAMVAGCGGGGGSGAPAAPVRVIGLNQQATGVLRTSDPRLNDGSVYHLWRFAGNGGQTVQIDLLSDDFDAFLILQDANGNVLAQDDDDGDGTNARIVFTLPATTQYRVIANTYRDGASGTYTLRLSTGSATPGGSGNVLMSGVQGTLTFGQLVSGRLTDRDARLSDNSVFHAWLFHGRAGQRITLEVMSDDFDAYAIVQDARGTKLAEDDDSGDELNARVTYTLPATGTYRLIANAYREGAFGRYRIHVH